MKRISLVLIAIGLSLISFAHISDNYITKDSLVMKQIADSILILSKHKYKYQKNTQNENGTFELTYLQDTSSNEKSTFTIYYIKTIIGANPDLETKGESFFKLITIRAKFLDIFPYWQKYINPSSYDTKVISYQNDIFTVMLSNYKNRQFSLGKSRDYWEINYIDR